MATEETLDRVEIRHDEFAFIGLNGTDNPAVLCIAPREIAVDKRPRYLGPYEYQIVGYEGADCGPRRCERETSDCGTCPVGLQAIEIRKLSGVILTTTDEFNSGRLTPWRREFNPMLLEESLLYVRS
jgi:hypothetical protein